MTYHIISVVTVYGKKNCGDKEVKSDYKRFFISLRAAFFSSSPNINAIAANCLLENEWGCIFDGGKCEPPITCYAGRWLNTTVWTQTNLTEWRGNDDGTETWRIVWIGPKSVSVPLPVVMYCGAMYKAHFVHKVRLVNGKGGGGDFNDVFCLYARMHVTGTLFMNETLVWNLGSVSTFCRCEKSLALPGFKPRIFQLEPQSLNLLQDTDYC